MLLLLPAESRRLKKPIDYERSEKGATLRSGVTGSKVQVGAQSCSKVEVESSTSGHVLPVM